MKDGQDIELVRSLMTQFSLSGSATALADAADLLGEIANIINIGNLFLTFFMSGGGDHMFSMVETQQLLVLTPIFNLDMDALTSTVFEVFIMIATFDILENIPPALEIFDLMGHYDTYFEMPEGEPMNP